MSPPPRGLVPKTLGDAPRDPDEVGFDALERQPFGVGQGQGAEVADEPGQKLGLRVQLGELSAVERHDAVLHGVELALQDSQRCAELVRDVGD